AFAQEHPEELPASAALLEEMARPDDAEPLYRELAAQSPQTGTLLLAKYLGRRQRVDEALQLCEAARQTAPAQAVAEASAAVPRNAAAKDPHFQAVAGWLTEAAGQAPHSIRLIERLAELQFQWRHYPEAITRYRQVVQDEPHNVVALNQLAWLLALKDGQGAEALSLIQRALDLIGPLPDLLDTRAVVYLTLNQPQPAIDDLEEVVRLSPTAPAFFHLARAYYQAKDHPKATEAFRKAKERGLSPLVLHPLERRAYNHLLGALLE